MTNNHHRLLAFSAISLVPVAQLAAGVFVNASATTAPPNAIAVSPLGSVFVQNPNGFQTFNSQLGLIGTASISGIRAIAAGSDEQVNWMTDNTVIVGGLNATIVYGYSGRTGYGLATANDGSVWSVFSGHVQVNSLIAPISNFSGNTWATSAFAGIAVSPTNSNLAWAVKANQLQSIFRFQSGSGGVGYGTVSIPISNPTGIDAASDGSVFVVGDTTLLRYQNGTSTTVSTGVNTNPSSVSISGTNRVYVLASGTGEVKVYDTNLSLLTTFGSAGAGNGQLSAIAKGIEVTNLGNIYIADRGNNRVVRWFEPAEWTAAGTNTFGDLNLGNNALSLSTGKNLAVGTTLTIGTNTAITVNGGGLTAGAVAGDGVIRHQSGDVAFASNATVDARYIGSRGTVLNAAGNLSIGKASRVDGFTTDGELNIGAYDVTLSDSNRATLGVLTTLGTASGAGTLNAANGLFIDYDGNLTGRGTVNTSTAPAKASVINGAVVGDSLANPIVFTGYIKGAGTFDNVQFDGTYSPGLSPTLQYVGNVILGSANTLEMELGGLVPGDDHDQLVSSGTVLANGVLKVLTIDGFSPELGDSFDLFDGTLSGEFASIQLPTLSSTNWTWDTSALYSSGVISVAAVPEPAACTVLALAAVGLLSRRRSRAS